MAYVEKALKEAKQNSSWIAPNEPHDQAVKEFISRLLDPNDNEEFVAAFERFMRKPQWAAYWNGLSQVLLKITSPGVPDIYQGTELWDLSLVDPDNRRPVDYEYRNKALAKMKAEFASDPTAMIDRLLANPHDGCIKLWVMHRALAYRKSNPQLFTDGTYEALEVAGERSDQVIAFARSHGQRSVIVLTSRFMTRFANQLKRPVGQAWGKTMLQLPGSITSQVWKDVLTGQVIEGSEDGHLPLAALFSHLPVAILELSQTSH